MSRAGAAGEALSGAAAVLLLLLTLTDVVHFSLSLLGFAKYLTV